MNMLEEQKIEFDFDKKTYNVGIEAFTNNFYVELPNGKVLSLEDWEGINSNSPRPRDVIDVTNQLKMPLETIKAEEQ